MKAAGTVDDIIQGGSKAGGWRNSKWAKWARFAPWAFAGVESGKSVHGFNETAELMGPGHSIGNTTAEVGGALSFAAAGTGAAGGAAGALPLFALYAMGDQFQGYLQANENLRKQVESLKKGMTSGDSLYDPANGMMMISKFMMQNNLLQTAGTPFPVGTWEEQNYLDNMDWKDKMAHWMFPADFGMARYEPAPAAIGSTISQQRDVQGSNPYIVFTLQNSDGAPTSSYSMPFTSSWAFQHGMQLEENGQDFTFQLHNHGIDLGN